MPQPLHTADCSIRAYADEHAVHAHDHGQLLYALQGSMEVEVQGHLALVDACCGLWIPAGCAHGYGAAPGAQMLVMDVGRGLLTPALERQRSFRVPPAARCAPAAMAWPQRLALLLAAPSLQARRRLDSLALARRVQAALHEDWPTARLAALCHLSPQRFHARWLELLGQTPQQWLRQLRLERAEQELAAGRRLDATALVCGYASASALAYALRRDRGSSARQLRAPTAPG